jgi:hypothetical protein
MDIESFNRPLVVCAAGREATGDSDDVRLDAAFQMPAVRSLRLAPERIGDDGMEYITYRIVRSPKDLRNHVRRIVLQHDIGDSEALYAALLDLFIVLGNKGRALRKRVLDGARSRLGIQQYRALSACLDSDSVRCNGLPAPPDSMLAAGVIGMQKLVEAVDGENESTRDPLIEARDHIEYCQLEQAQAVLEQAIMDQPQRLELHEELLEIYRSTRDEASLLAFWRRLNDVHGSAPDLWQTAADSFSAGEAVA